MTNGQKLYRTIRPLIFGCITGIVTGGVIALFITCARVVCSFVFSAYAKANGALACVCLVILCLLCCVLTAVVQTLCPSGKGSGVPLAEGAARGMLKVKWLRTIAALIAGSLLSFACGMPLGSEGPSVGIGGLIGDGLGKTVKHSDELRRGLITGGASAGLAVAFNAPLTGVAFALEETHRRFSPNILIAAFSAVVPAVLTSQLIFWGLGQNAYLNALGIHEGLTILPHFTLGSYASAAMFFAVCGIAAIIGVITALIATAFNYSIFSLGAVFAKIKNPVLRLLPAFALTAVVGLTLHSGIGSGEATLEWATSATVWTVFALLAVRFIMTVTASASDATGGLFLPMIAISGLTGLLISQASTALGLPADYSNNLIMISIAAFFAATVRAPISATVMVLELTASFSNVLPIAIAVAISTAVSGLLKSAPLYEHMMTDLQKSEPRAAASADVCVRGRVNADSAICGRRIRDILWPYNSLVISLTRADGNNVVPDGETIINADDVLTICAQAVVPEEFDRRIGEYIVVDNTSAEQHVGDRCIS